MTKEVEQNCTFDISQLDFLRELGADIVTREDIPDILQFLYKKINDFLNAPLIGFGVVNSIKKLSIWGIDSDYNITSGLLNQHDDRFYGAQCYSRSIELNSFCKEPFTLRFEKSMFRNSKQQVRSYVYVPLQTNRGTIGFMTIQSCNYDAFNDENLKILRFIAAYLSMAIDNVRYYEETESQKSDLQSVIDNMEEIIQLRTTTIKEQKEKVEAQAALLEEKNKELEILSIVAQKTENAIMIMDPKGNILWVNNYFQHIYGFSFKQFLKKRGANITETSFNKNIKEDVKRCLETKSVVLYEAQNIKNNGEPIWTQTSLSPVLDVNNNVNYLVTIDSDITKIKVAEQIITNKSKELFQSIEYASRIQRAAFPSNKYFKSILPESFILWKPLNIVSGDFYWIKQVQNKIVLAVGDCTGHGVPGALLTMLGCSFLEDIIISHTWNDAADILNELQEHFDRRFRHEVMGIQVADGMDISICVISPEQNILNFSSANNQLVMVRECGIKQVKGDRNCVGLQHSSARLFSNHIVEYNENDTFYLFSDGYASQFGGEDHKKYMTRRMVQFFNTMCSLPMNDQKNILENEFKMWKGKDNEQTDDVLVVGFKL